MRDSEWKGLREGEDLQRLYVKKGDLGRNSKRNKIKKRGGDNKSITYKLPNIT